MKVKCEICKKKIDEEGMLWAKDYDINICTYCYEKKHEEGYWMRAMPLRGFSKFEVGKCPCCGEELKSGK